ncbi:MAG: SxtJ family membrane protein, partial [Myxococcota bacterium]
GVFAGIALLAGATSLVYPKANLPLYIGMTLLAYPIGFVLSYVIMGALFYGMLAPVGLFFRVTGRDPLRRRFEPESESYWTDAGPPRPKEGYFRQF